jgi:hypothetical protein
LQKLLDLRFEAEFAIMASMDYARTNLNALRAKGYAIDDLNDTEKEWGEEVVDDTGGPSGGETVAREGVKQLGECTSLMA